MDFAPTVGKAKLEVVKIGVHAHHVMGSARK